MKIILKERGQGKTTQLIQESASQLEQGKNAIILCHSEPSVLYIKERAKDLNCQIPEPMTYANYVNGNYRGLHIDSILIDNLDMFFKFIIPIPVGAFTFDSTTNDVELDI